jgi:hypothetical protein
MVPAPPMAWSVEECATGFFGDVLLHLPQFLKWGGVVSGLLQISRKLRVNGPQIQM